MHLWAVNHPSHAASCVLLRTVQMRQIPGVGPYTAAAVASIAFNDPAAAVDGNVIRVISRLRALKGNPTKMAKTWDRLAAELLHQERPGCHNQVRSAVCSRGSIVAVFFWEGMCGRDARRMAECWRQSFCTRNAQAATTSCDRVAAFSRVRGQRLTATATVLLETLSRARSGPCHL